VDGESLELDTEQALSIGKSGRKSDKFSMLLAAGKYLPWNLR
jgi:hypothetical protein